MEIGILIVVVIAVIFYFNDKNEGGKDNRMHMTSLCEEFINHQCVIIFDDTFGAEKVRAKLLGYDEYNIKYETTKKDVKSVVVRKVDDIIEISSVC
jgi:hypothetical protein